MKSRQAVHKSIILLTANQYNVNNMTLPEESNSEQEV